MSIFIHTMKNLLFSNNLDISKVYNATKNVFSNAQLTTKKGKVEIVIDAGDINMYTEYVIQGILNYKILWYYEGNAIGENVYVLDASTEDVAHVADIPFRYSDDFVTLSSYEYINYEFHVVTRFAKMTPHVVHFRMTPFFNRVWFWVELYKRKYILSYTYTRG